MPIEAKFLDVNQLRHNDFAGYKKSSLPNDSKGISLDKNEKLAKTYVVTNCGLDKEYYYCLKIEPESVLMVEERSTAKRKYYYDRNTEELSVNDKKVDSSFIKQFKLKYQKIQSEVKYKKAKIYEKIED